MLQNYLTTFIRILLRQKTYSAINVGGLSIGIAALILIALYISDELSYDRFHRDADRIYRVTVEGSVPGGGDFNSVKVGYPVAEALQNEVPVIESTVRVKLLVDVIQPIRYEDRAFASRKFLYADSNFFDFFDFKLLVGNKSNALQGPNKVVLTETMAKKLFDLKGNDYSSVIGKTIQVADPLITAIVTGVAEDPPSNSHFHFEVLCSSESYELMKKNRDWTSINAAITYFKLRPGADIGLVDSAYARFLEKYVAAEWERVFKTSWEGFKKNGGTASFKSQRLLDIHLKSNFRNEFEPNGNLQYIYLFAAVGLLIIVLACVNFTNLSTARAITRAKEIGIRKSVGALRYRLIRQFLIESFLYTLFAVVIAIALVSAFLSSFNLLSGKELTITDLLKPPFIAGISMLTIMVSVTAGGHPAFLLTSFKPASVLKGTIHSVVKGAGIRKALVVFQFCISLSMVICTLIVYQQLQFIQNRSLGFDKENILRINNAFVLHKNLEPFKRELLRDPGIINAGYSMRLPPDIKEAYAFMAIGAYPEEHLASTYSVDYDHLETMGFQMAKGRFFSRDFPSDTSAIIINEKAASEIGFEKFEGRKITSPGAFGFSDTLHVIGIIKDFHLQGLQSPIKPLLLLLNRNDNAKDKMAIRLNKGYIKSKINFIETLWKKYAPEAAIEYGFLDEEFDAQYRSEQKLGEVFSLFTVLAVIIACLGLFGLAAFTAEQRTKEIGIRKVMGSSVMQAVTLLSKDFIKLVLISFIIAIPISWYGMNKWLEGFAYRIDFDFAIVLLAGLFGFVLTLFTVGYQSISAAKGNPAQSLRSE